MSTYALYAGWESDRLAEGMAKYRGSNLVMVGMLGASIVSAVLMECLLRVVDGKARADEVVVDCDGNVDGDMDEAAIRESKQRGLKGVWYLRWMMKS